MPALADQKTVEIRDRDTLFVGEPTGEGDLHVEQQFGGYEVEAGTHKIYEFTVEPDDNRLEIDLSYDTGSFAELERCVRTNDLDLFVDGPGFSRAYPGCDNGKITVLRDDVPTGDYTVRVEASQGSTVCIPNEPIRPCSAPAIEYMLVINVWDVED